MSNGLISSTVHSVSQLEYVVTPTTTRKLIIQLTMLLPLLLEYLCQHLPLLLHQVSTVGRVEVWLPLWKVLGSNIYLKTSFPVFFNEFTPSYT